MSSKTTEINEPWMAHLHKEFIFYEKGTVEHDIATIIQDMLLSRGCEDAEHPAPRAARQIDDYYWERNLDSGPLFRFQKEDDAFPDVLSVVYTVILDIAPLLHYNDARHDSLVRLLVELRKIPPKPVEAWNGNYLVHPNDTLFAELLDHAWSGNFEWKDKRDKSVNFSAFLARCIAARFDSHIDISKYPGYDIPEALEENNHTGVKQDSSIMIAAQYILLAGCAIDEEIVQKEAEDGRSWGLNKWQMWGERFKDLSEQELSPDVRTAVIDARTIMVSLHPELFTISDGGNKR